MLQLRRVGSVRCSPSVFRCGCVLWALGAVIGAPYARATSFMERPFPETVKESQAIVRGKIGMKYAKDSLGSDGRSRIYTYYELQLDEVFKGKGLEAGRQIMVREIGGEKDGIGLQVAGAAQFQRGEDVVILLGRANPDDSYDVQGLMMGKYTLEKDSEGHEYLTGAGVSSLTHPAIRGHEQIFQGANTKAPIRWSLENLRKLLQEQESAAPPVTSEAKTPNSARNPEASPKPSPSVKPSKQPAPLLQSDHEGESTSSDPGYVAWAVGGLAVVLLIAAFLLLKR